MRCDDQDTQTKSADEFVCAALHSNQHNDIETDLMKKHLTEESEELSVLLKTVRLDWPFGCLQFQCLQSVPNEWMLKLIEYSYVCQILQSHSSLKKEIV